MSAQHAPIQSGYLAPTRPARLPLPRHPPSRRRWPHEFNGAGSPPPDWVTSRPKRFLYYFLLEYYSLLQSSPFVCTNFHNTVLLLTLFAMYSLPRTCHSPEPYSLLHNISLTFGLDYFCLNFLLLSRRLPLAVLHFHISRRLPTLYLSFILCYISWYFPFFQVIVHVLFIYSYFLSGFTTPRITQLIDPHETWIITRQCLNCVCNCAWTCPCIAHVIFTYCLL